MCPWVQAARSARSWAVAPSCGHGQHAYRKYGEVISSLCAHIVFWSILLTCCLHSQDNQCSLSLVGSRLVLVTVVR